MLIELGILGVTAIGALRRLRRGGVVPGQVQQATAAALAAQPPDAAGPPIVQDGTAGAAVSALYGGSMEQPTVQLDELAPELAGGGGIAPGGGALAVLKAPPRPTGFYLGPATPAPPVVSPGSDGTAQLAPRPPLPAPQAAPADSGAAGSSIVVRSLQVGPGGPLVAEQ